MTCLLMLDLLSASTVPNSYIFLSYFPVKMMSGPDKDVLKRLELFGSTDVGQSLVASNGAPNDHVIEYYSRNLDSLLERSSLPQGELPKACLVGREIGPLGGSFPGSARIVAHRQRKSTRKGAEKVIGDNQLY